jgi:hypothetical protein
MSNTTVNPSPFGLNWYDHDAARREGTDVTLTHGPVMTEYGPSCSGEAERCAHFAVHDWLYFYCSAQPVDGQTYPWPGAGTQLRHHAPNAGCPYAKEPK